jgi:antitoxin MazE6
MRTAVSIPDDLYQAAERLARRTGKSRSRLFSDALREYLAHHAPDEVTEAMNRACAEAGEAKDPFVASAAHRILARSEW